MTHQERFFNILYMAVRYIIKYIIYIYCMIVIERRHELSFHVRLQLFSDKNMRFLGFPRWGTCMAAGLGFDGRVWMPGMSTWTLLNAKYPKVSKATQQFVVWSLSFFLLEQMFVAKKTSIISLFGCCHIYLSQSFSWNKNPSQCPFDQAISSRFYFAFFDGATLLSRNKEVLFSRFGVNLALLPTPRFVQSGWLSTVVLSRSVSAVSRGHACSKSWSRTLHQMRTRQRNGKG